MNIAISGATGLVGKSVAKLLQHKGHNIRKLVRKVSDNKDEFLWDISKNYVDEKIFENLDCIIHLAGSTVAKRWTATYKKEMYDSRIASANLLFDRAKKNNTQLKSFISASGINYYGTFTSDQILHEEDAQLHQDFLSQLCVDWELAAKQFNAISERVVTFRISPVLSKNGGSFEQLEKVTDYQLASGLGKGNQWFCWIHLEDLINMIIYSVENQNINGAYNAISDEITTQKNFMKRLAKAKNKFFFPINVPAFMLKTIFGEMSTMILNGTRASNNKIKSAGFQLLYPDLDTALDDLLQK